jgi:hypothetical protein
MLFFNLAMLCNTIIHTQHAQNQFPSFKFPFHQCAHSQEPEMVIPFQEYIHFKHKNI